MTLNSYAPSVLVEMGFIFNPSDFDSMRSKQGIYNTVTTISGSIIASTAKSLKVYQNNCLLIEQERFLRRKRSFICSEK